MRRRRFITGVAGTTLNWRLAPAAELPARLVLASVVGQTEGFAFRWLTLIYNDAFRQLGVALDIRALPAARAAVEAQAGNVDGELARNQGYELVQTVLVRVPEPAVFVTTAAYARGTAIQLAPGWEGLRGTAYRVEHRFGYVVMEKKLAAVVPAANLIGVLNAETGLRKLALGRSDLFVDNAEVVDPLLSTAEFRDAGIRQASILERGAVYAFLNKKYAAVAPPLGAILKKMRDSGQIERYRLQALRETTHQD